MLIMQREGMLSMQRLREEYQHFKVFMAEYYGYTIKLAQYHDC